MLRRLALLSPLSARRPLSSRPDEAAWRDFAQTKYFAKQERFDAARDLEPQPSAEKVAASAERLRLRFAEYQALLNEQQFRKRFHTLFVSAARMQQYHEIELRAQQQVRELHPELERTNELKFLSLVKFRVIDEYGHVYNSIRRRIVQNELPKQRKLRYEDEVNAYLNKIKRL